MQPVVSHSDHEGSTVKEVIADIQRRTVKQLFMPYSWEKSYSSTTSLPGVFEDDVLDASKAGALFENGVLRQNMVTHNIGLGELLRRCKADLIWNRQFNSFPIDLSDAGMVNFLNNIHFWLLNHRRSDINAQSYVMSCRFPKLNMSFVFTGDADDSTFQELKVRTRMPTPATFLRRGNDKHLIWLFLPHHGSDENDSKVMYELFDPDAYVITAGNGSQHGHPRKSIVDNLPGYTRRDSGAYFWQTYKFNRDNPDFPFFKFESTNDKGLDRRYPAVVHRTIPNSTPIFCPNIVQCLHMDASGDFYQQMDMTPVEFANNQFLSVKLSYHQYELDLLRVTDETIVQRLQAIYKGQDFIEMDGDWFVLTTERNRVAFDRISDAQKIVGNDKIPLRSYLIKEFKDQLFLYNLSSK